MTACMRGSVLTSVVAEALSNALRAGMDQQTTAEWVAIEVLASPLVPMTSHFPAEGGGPCSTCGQHFDTRPLPPAECPSCSGLGGDSSGPCFDCQGGLV